MDRGDEAEGLARPASEMSMSLGPSDWRRRTGTGGATRREGAIDWRREARLAACGFVGSAALASSHDVCSVRMSALDMPSGRQGAGKIRKIVNSERATDILDEKSWGGAPLGLENSI